MIKNLLLLLISQLIAISLFSQNNSSIKLIKPTVNNIDVSGDKQVQKVETELEKPLKVYLENYTDSSKLQVSFKLLSSPSGTKGYEIVNSTSLVDSSGYAQTNFILGDQAGKYVVLACVKEHPEAGQLIYTFEARKKNWVLMLFIGLIGGLSLFLFGMFMMSEGMKRAAGDNLRSLLSQVTNNRLSAVALGTFITMVIQSSSATTVMLITFVQSKLMKFKRTLGVILGAGIGTTITAQIIAFHLSDYSLLLVAIGFSVQAFSKSKKLKSIGTTFLGFGILFFAMQIMSDSMSPLRTYPPIISLLVQLKNPVIGIIAGALFTAIIQSSSAFIGILIVLSSQGLITLEAAIPLVFGSNIGTAITAILASINATREATKVALAHTLFKIFGVLIFITWIPSLKDLVIYISPKQIPGSESFSYLARQIANTHMLFNIGLTVILLPFINAIGNLIDKILPEKDIEPEQKLITRYLDYKKINSPTLALSLAKQEVIRMARNVQDMVDDILIPFLTKKTEILKNIELKEQKINFLRDKIKQYLLDILQETTDETQSREAFQTLYIVKELEQVADIISTTLLVKAKRWSKKDYEFSQDGKSEIIESHLIAQKQISRAISVIDEVNLEKAQRMRMKYKKYRAIAMEFEKHHYERLRNEIPESLRSSKTHLELLTMLRTITSHATNIARILLRWNSEEN